MSDQFEEVVAKMPLLLDRLQSSEPLKRDRLSALPQRGVYAFYEKGIPIYVGRSNRLRQRLQEHSRPSSVHNSATFAYLIAMEEAERRRIDCHSKTRDLMQVDPEFEPLYRQAKDRVRCMDIRAIEVADPIEQTMFEVYAALKLESPYNSFENH